MNSPNDLKQKAVEALDTVTDQPGQRTVSLKNGYLHYDSATGKTKSFKTVTVRAPNMRDVINRDVQLAKLARSTDEHDQLLATSENMSELLLILQCIVNWHGIAAPSHVHLMELTRSDAIALSAAVTSLELEREAAGNEEKSETSASS